MFRTARRYVLFVITALLPVGSLFLGIYLKLLTNPKHSVIGLIFLGVLILSLISSYYVHVKPIRELTPAVMALLDCVGQRIVDIAHEDQLQARINYLKIFRPARCLFFRRYFRVAWGIGMKYKSDNAVQFHISKGVAGRTLKERTAMCVNLELPENNNFGNFSEKEQTLFPPLKAIWSLPIFELDKASNPTGKILGVINLDSETAGAAEAFRANLHYQWLLEELQDLVSKVASC